MNWILILIAIYCPWIIPVAFVIFLFFMLYHECELFFWILIIAIIAFCICAVVYSNRQ